MTVTAVFWVILVALFFAFALAVQMRVITAHVLRKALQARDSSLSPRQTGEAVALAASATVPEGAGDGMRAAIGHLMGEYPRPLSHLRIARRASLALPLAMFLLVAARRLLGAGLEV
jgi:hypothetical protein